jgi:hypothetical protein
MQLKRAAQSPLRGATALEKPSQHIGMPKKSLGEKLGYCMLPAHIANTTELSKSCKTFQENKVSQAFQFVEGMKCA